MNGSNGNMHWLNSLADAWWGWMVPVSFQVLVLLLVVYAIDRLLGRKAWPKLLSALWLLVLIKLVLPPSLTSPISLANVFDFSYAGTSAAQPTDSAALGLAAHPDVANSGGVPTAARFAEPPASWQAAVPLVCFSVWLGGFLLLGLILFRRYRRVRNMIAPANQLEAPPWLNEQLARCGARLNMRTIPRLIVVDAAVGPAVFGVFRPVIVVPASILQATSSAELEHVLLHELTHIKRRDPVWDFAALLLSLSYWIHPGVWFARRRLSTVRELCCDEAVATALGEHAPEYRRTLLAISRPIWAPAGLAFFPRRSQLLERIEHLAQSRSANSCRHRVAAIAIVVLVAICVIPLSADKSAARSPNRAEHLAADSLTKTENSDKDLAARIAEQSIQPPETTPVTYEMPPLDELQGCMQLRYAVFAEMAKQAKAAKPNP